MGGAVTRFATYVGKSIAKGATSFVLGKVPVIGTPVADWINSKYADGGVVGENLSVPIPAGFKPKAINTEKDLLSLISKFPIEASKAGLSADLVKQEVQSAKEETKMMKKGGVVMKRLMVPTTKVKEPKRLMIPTTKVKEPKKPKVKKEPKRLMVGPKPPRSEAQIAATAKLVAFNKMRRAKK